MKELQKYRNDLISKIIVATLEEIDPQYPPAPHGIDFSKMKIPS